MLRCAPYVKKLYGVELPLNEMRDRIRSEFERHPRFQDPAVVDMLVFKGKQELEETLKQVCSCVISRLDCCRTFST
jgi:NADH dehydrogenase (ubiquinone) 1 alpha subcomplex subunit 6